MQLAEALPAVGFYDKLHKKSTTRCSGFPRFLPRFARLLSNLRVKTLMVFPSSSSFLPKYRCCYHTLVNKGLASIISFLISSSMAVMGVNCGLPV